MGKKEIKMLCPKCKGKKWVMVVGGVDVNGEPMLSKDICTECDGIVDRNDVYEAEEMKKEMKTMNNENPEEYEDDKKQDSEPQDFTEPDAGDGLC
jgi:hypothetical protein